MQLLYVYTVEFLRVQIFYFIFRHKIDRRLHPPPPLPKKGDLVIIKNYRGITVSVIAAS